MAILFKWDLANAIVRAVECPKPSYPNKDADGDKIFENTHFKREEDAWKHLEDEASAWVRSTARELADLRNRETKATRELADRTLVLVRVQETRAERKGKP
jgi:hypothetical protein